MTTVSALKPLTELEVAKAVGVHGTTVSRTVRDKYASTPQGTVELRRFFATGVKAVDGSTVTTYTDVNTAFDSEETRDAT